MLAKTLILIATAALSISAVAKLPVPVLTDEAKAKAAETAAKTAWSGKVDAFQLCKVQNQTAVAYFKSAKATGKETNPAAETPACADPGAFVYTPAPAAVPAPAAAASAPATPAKPA